MRNWLFQYKVPVAALMVGAALATAGLLWPSDTTPNPVRPLLAGINQSSQYYLARHAQPWLTCPAAATKCYRWTMQEAAGNLTDDLSGDNTVLTANGTPTYRTHTPIPDTTGMNGRRGIAFNSVADYFIATGNTVGDQTTNNFSFSFWFYDRSGPPPQRILAKRDGANVGWDIYHGHGGTGNFGFYIKDSVHAACSGAIFPAGSIAVNSWHFVTLNFDRAANASALVDGAAMGAGAPIATCNGSVASAIPLNMGRFSGGGSSLNGSLSEVLIANGLTTLAEHQAAYKAFKVPTATSPGIVGTLAYSQTTTRKWPLPPEVGFGERLGVYAGSATNPQWPAAYDSTRVHATKNPLGLGFPRSGATTNTLGDVNDCSTANWIKAGTPATCTANTTEAPDGSMTADTITLIANGDYIRKAAAGGGSLGAGGRACNSVYIKKLSGTCTTVSIYDFGVNPSSICTLPALSTDWTRYICCKTNTVWAYGMAFRGAVVNNCAFAVADMQHELNNVTPPCTSTTGDVSQTCNASYFTTSWSSKATLMPQSLERMEVVDKGSSVPMTAAPGTVQTKWMLGNKAASLQEGVNTALTINNQGGDQEYVAKYRGLSYATEARDYTSSWDLRNGLTNTTYLSLDNRNVRQKLTPRDVYATELFGSSISVTDTTLAIGAMYDDETANNSGAVYVYTKVDNVWTLQQKLKATVPIAFAGLGFTVDVDGDTLATGAVDEDGGRGAVYVFTRSGGVWTQQQKITVPGINANANFGDTMLLQGDTLITSAMQESTLGAVAGRAYVYTRSGGVWAQTQNFTATDTAAGDAFGGSSAIAGNTLVIGATGAGAVANSGAAYIFTNTTGSWVQAQKIEASDATAWDAFGNAVAINGTRVAVGAWGKMTGAVATGGAYIFENTAGTWAQTAILTPGGSPAAWIGQDVALAGNSLAVGGVAYSGSRGGIFVYTKNGTSWLQSNPPFTAVDAVANARLGYKILVQGDDMYAAAYQDVINSTADVGSVYVIPAWKRLYGGLSVSRNGATSVYTPFNLEGRKVDATIDAATPANQRDLNSTTAYVGCDVSSGSPTNCSQGILESWELWGRPAQDVKANDSTSVLNADFTGAAFMQAQAIPRFSVPAGATSANTWIWDMGEYSGSLYDRINGVALAPTGTPRYQAWSGLLARGQGRRGIWQNSANRVGASAASILSIADRTAWTIETLATKTIGSLGDQLILDTTNNSTTTGYGIILRGYYIDCLLRDSAGNNLIRRSGGVVMMPGLIYHLACVWTFSAGTWTGVAYINGFEPSGSNVGVVPTTTVPNGGAFYLNSTTANTPTHMYEAMISDKARSAAEILAHYKQSIQQGTYWTDDANTLAHYKFNETSITNGVGLRDHSGNGNHLTVVAGTPTPQYADMPWPAGSGTYKPSVEYNAAGNYHSGGAATGVPSNAQPFSLCTWVRFYQIPAAAQVIVSKGTVNDYYDLSIMNATGNPRFRFNTNEGGLASTTTATSVSDNNWHLLCAKVAYAGGTYTPYISIDGGAFAYTAGSTTTGDPSGNGANLVFGTGLAASPYQLGGEITIKDYALTDADVAAMYKAGSTPLSTMTYTRTSKACLPANPSPVDGERIRCWKAGDVPFSYNTSIPAGMGNARYQFMLPKNDAVINLALQSEDATTTWANTNTTDAANTAVSPDGSTTADTVTATAAAGDLRQVFAAIAATPSTYCQYLKRNGAADVPGFVRMVTNSTGVQIAQTAFTASTGWARWCVSGTPTLNDTRIETQITTNATSVFWWGAQLSATAAWPGVYSPTTVAATTANASSAYVAAANISGWTRAQGAVTNLVYSNAAGSYSFDLSNGVNNNGRHYQTSQTSEFFIYRDDATLVQRASLANAQVNTVTGSIIAWDNANTFWTDPAGTARRSYARTAQSNYSGPYPTFTTDTGAAWNVTGGQNLHIGQDNTGANKPMGVVNVSVHSTR